LDFEGTSSFFKWLIAEDAHKRFGFHHESNEGIAGRKLGADFWYRFQHSRGNLAANRWNRWFRRRDRHGLPTQQETN
jgi:hypothetical protein